MAYTCAYTYLSSMSGDFKQLLKIFCRKYTFTAMRLIMCACICIHTQTQTHRHRRTNTQTHTHTTHTHSHMCIHTYTNQVYIQYDSYNFLNI